jgi:hypothetical protein
LHFQNSKENKTIRLYFTVLIIILFSFCLQLNVHALKEIHYKKHWIKNSDFSNSTSQWFPLINGDFSDVNAKISSEQANYEILGETGIFSFTADPPLESNWSAVINPEFPSLPEFANITPDGCRVSHQYDDQTAVQNPSAHWDKNFTLPVNITDYIITSASIKSIVYANASLNVDRAGDTEARNDHVDSMDTYDIGDYVRFYVLISDLEKEIIYEIAYLQPDDLGAGDPPGEDIFPDTYMITVPEEVLIFYISSVLNADRSNFTLTLGMRLYFEDNIVVNWDYDKFNELIIKNVNLTFTYEKKIDQATIISWNQIGEAISGSNTEITNASLNFKYKINQIWDISLSFNSEMRILINNYEIDRFIKLSSLSTNFQELELSGFDVMSNILKNTNISLSIQIFIADEFALDHLITISVDDVYLEISYMVWFETAPPSNNLIWIALIISLIVIALLTTLSLRSYIFQPRKQRKFSLLQLRTQRFKDINNIQGIILIHNPSGLPIFSRSYSLLMKGKKTLFSGFIQAVSIIGEEFGKESPKRSKAIKSSDGIDYHKIIELDLKKFRCLILDIEELRTVLILKSKSSKRLQRIMFDFSLALYLKISEELKTFDNDLTPFPEIITPLLDEYFELYYKEDFITELHEKDIQTIKKEFKLTKFQVQIMITVFLILKEKLSFRLMNIVEELKEKNENSIIDGIESLIEKKLILPYNR